MTIPNHYIWLYSDHTILYMVKLVSDIEGGGVIIINNLGPLYRLSLLLSCAMKFQAYPHDTQNCTLKIESRK